MALTAKRAHCVAAALNALDEMDAMHGLRIHFDMLGLLLVDADDTIVCRVEYDAAIGQFIAKEAY